jgi:hypothetical protein
LCACFDFDDKREENEVYNLYSKINGEYDIKFSELLPGDWELVCIVEPGSTPSIMLKLLLPLNFHMHAAVKDPDDFPDHLWKLILLDQSGKNIRLLQIDKRDFEFRGILCTRTEDKHFHFTEKKEVYNGKERSVFLVDIK